MAFKPPTPFNFHEPAEWSAWRSRFGHFRLASKLSKEEQEVQVSALLYCMGPEGSTAHLSWQKVIGHLTQFYPNLMNILSLREILFISEHSSIVESSYPKKLLKNI